MHFLAKLMLILYSLATMSCFRLITCFDRKVHTCRMWWRMCKAQSYSGCANFDNDDMADALSKYDGERISIKNKSKSAQKRLAKEQDAMRKANEAFCEFYRPIIGDAFWDEVIKAMQRPVKYCALGNKWSDKNKLIKLLGIESGDTVSYLPHYFNDVYVRKGSSPSAQEKWPAPSLETSLDAQGLCCYYPLDAASLLPVALLKLQGQHRVLDMCAAPGGKSVAILQHLGELGRLISSDVSSDRLARLRRSICSYLPEKIRDEMVNIITGDGTLRGYCERLGYRSFDRVLLDAPCSSERHVLQKPAELLKWSPGRSKNNAKRQVRLLYNALHLCKVGGRVVYSTCSLSPQENDLVVSKALRTVAKKRLDESGALDAEYRIVTGDQLGDIPFGKATELGWHVVPDDKNPWGPIYVSVIDVGPCM